MCFYNDKGSTKARYVTSHLRQTHTKLISQVRLSDCLLFSSEYNRGENGGESFYTYHAYEQNVEDGMHEVQALPDSALAVARLAGRKR